MKPELEHGTKISGHIPALDGLRGIAILAVLFGHCTWREQRFYGGIGDFVFALADSSWCGVDLFFVLSGFLITGILYDAKQSRSYFTSFYMRRVLRIFPLYYAVLIAAVFVVPALVPANPEVQDLVAHQGWLWLFSGNVLIGMQQQWFFDTPFVSLGHFWSLAVEEHFYFVWPLVVFFLGRKWLMAVSVAAIVVALGIRCWLLSMGANETPLYVLTWCRMDSLAAGALLALLVRGPRGIDALVKPACAVLLVTGALLCAMIFAQGGVLTYHEKSTMAYVFTLLAGFCGALLILAVASPKGSLAQAFFSSPLLRFFGKYSYALYVLQAVPRQLYHTLFPLESLTVFFGSYRVALGVFSMLLLGTMVVMALLSWHLFEKHFLKLKRLFPYADGKPRPLELIPGKLPAPQV